MKKMALVSLLLISTGSFASDVCISITGLWDGETCGASAQVVCTDGTIGPWVPLNCSINSQKQQEETAQTLQDLEQFANPRGYALADRFESNLSGMYVFQKTTDAPGLKNKGYALVARTAPVTSAFRQALLFGKTQATYLVDTGDGATTFPTYQMDDIKSDDITQITQFMKQKGYGYIGRVDQSDSDFITLEENNFSEWLIFRQI